MSKSIEALVEDYDRGAISRRTFIQALAVVTASSGVSEATAATFRANSLNHVTLAVTDPAVSRKFYEETLGVNVVSRQSNGINMGLGDSFLGLYSIPEPGRIHHFCVGVDGNVIEDGAEKLRGAGIEPYVRQDRPELYFNDPDGVLIQLSEKEYRG